MEPVRDLFVFGCWVGLRYSDFSNVKPQNIITIDGEKFIKINTQKTGEQVVIPCNPVVLQIFDRYADSPNSLPRSLSNQKFSDYVKDACREAKLTETSRLITEPEKELWECVSSHMARRSFATNLYLDGYPTIEIMKITGHKTEKSFLKYIRVSKLDAARKLSAHMKKGGQKNCCEWWRKATYWQYLKVIVSRKTTKAEKRNKAVATNAIADIYFIGYWFFKANITGSICNSKSAGRLKIRWSGNLLRVA